MHLTPLQVAERLQVDHGKVIDWLNSRELVGINVASKAGGRPRWRISERELDAFLARRSTVRDEKSPRKQSRRPAQAIEFYK